MGSLPLPLEEHGKKNILLFGKPQKSAPETLVCPSFFHQELNGCSLTPNFLVGFAFVASSFPRFNEWHLRLGNVAYFMTPSLPLQQVA